MDPDKMSFLFGDVPEGFDVSDPDDRAHLVALDAEESLAGPRSAMRAIVAKQIVAGDPPVVWATTQRLVALGVDRRQALSELAMALTHATKVASWGAAGDLPLPLPDAIRRFFPRARTSPANGRVDGGTVPGMVSIDDAARMALALPEVTEGERHGHRMWIVAGKGFAWERPFSKADIRRFGEASPAEGPILAVSVADLGEKEAVLAAQPDAFFTIPHFDGYSAVLIQLDVVTEDALQEALVDGWLTCAPPTLADDYVKGEGGGSRAASL